MVLYPTYITRGCLWISSSFSSSEAAWNWGIPTPQGYLTYRKKMVIRLDCKIL